jgi:hypothetical protein
MLGGVWLFVLLSVLVYVGFRPCFPYKPVNSVFAFFSLNEIGRAPALLVKKNILYHNCFDKVLAFKISYYCSLVDYAIDMSEYNF